MKVKHLALGALLALGIAGFVEARALAHSPSPARVLAIASERLSLTPRQQQALLPLVERGIALRNRIRQEAESTMAADRAALARPDADLVAIAARHEALVDAELAEARSLRNDLLAFYEQELDPAQQAAARQGLNRRLDRLDRIRGGLSALLEEPRL